MEWRALLILPLALLPVSCRRDAQLSARAALIPRYWEIAREAINEGLQAPPKGFQDLPYASMAGGVFVRLLTVQEELGCQGFLQGVDDFPEAIRRAAQNAAFHDRRYAPVSAESLRAADLEITLVGTLRRMRRPEDFRLGRDAVYLRYHSYAGFMQPSVAREHGYTKREFLDAIAHKAGLLDGAWRNAAVELYAAPTREYRRPFLPDVPEGSTSLAR